MAITNWPEADRPREKLFTLGSQHLTDAELLAIFINTGTRGKTALDIARELLNEFGGLKKLLQANPQVLFQKQGLGKAKYAAIKAAIELGQRYFNDSIKVGEKLDTHHATMRFLASRLQDAQHEVFACLFLDARHHLLAYEELFKGTINESSVYPREVVKRGLAHNAAKIILAHNHPSGNPTPSEADILLTRYLRDSLALVDIDIIDHIIVGRPHCLSLLETGQL